MNTKITVFTVLLLTLFMSTIMLAQAVPLKEKNNDKFQDFMEAGSYSILSYVTGDQTYIPSMEKTDKLILSWNEAMLTYEISIDENTYVMGKDFSYTGYAQEIFWDPVFGGTGGMIFPSDYRATHLVVDYMYDFSAFQGGIEGTLMMRAVSQGGRGSIITSLAGTGDLQNVQIKAYVSNGGFIPPVTITFEHEGLVQGWPNIAPNP